MHAKEMQNIKDEIKRLQNRLDLLQKEEEQYIFQRNRYYNIISKYFDINYKFHLIQLKEEYRNSASPNFKFEIQNEEIIFSFYSCVDLCIHNINDILKTMLEESENAIDYHEQAINDEKDWQKICHQILSELSEI